MHGAGIRLKRLSEYFSDCGWNGDERIWTCVKLGMGGRDGMVALAVPHGRRKGDMTHFGCII